MKKRMSNILLNPMKPAMVFAYRKLCSYFQIQVKPKSERNHGKCPETPCAEDYALPKK